jgi:hypothetical protein
MVAGSNPAGIASVQRRGESVFWPDTPHFDILLCLRPITMIHSAIAEWR